MFKIELFISSYTPSTFLFPVSENGTTSHQITKARTSGVIFDSSSCRAPSISHQELLCISLIAPSFLLLPWFKLS